MKVETMTDKESRVKHPLTTMIIDEGDSYHRQVKEFQRRAISRFPVRCRTISDAH